MIEGKMKINITIAEKTMAYAPIAPLKSGLCTGKIMENLPTQ